MKNEEERLDDNEISTKRNLKKTSNTSGRKSKGKKSKKEKITKEKKEIKHLKNFEELNELEKSYETKDNIDECISHLETYYNNLKIIDLENIINKRNMKIFQKINFKENVQIDLLLIKIYSKIFSAEDLYNNYFEDISENKKKLSLVLNLIEETIAVIDDFSDDFISWEFFKLKENLLKLIKYIYINLKEEITDEEKDHLNKLINELPISFFSENYLELIKYKNLIYKNNNELLKNIEEIDNLFFDLKSYYEQLNIIKLLLNDIQTDENKDKINNFSSISIQDIKSLKKKKNKKKKKGKKLDEDEMEGINENKIKNKIEYTDEDIIIYGQFLLKLCLYQKFHIVKNEDIKNNKKNGKKNIVEKDEEEEDEDEKEEDEEEEDEKNIKKNGIKEAKNKKEKVEEEMEENDEEEEEEEEDQKNVLSLFVIDAVKTVNGRIQNKSNENIEIDELLDDKVCISLNERENILEIIKKNIDNFNNLTKKSKNKVIKTLKEKLNAYISDINNNKYIPITFEKINKIKLYNNFSKNTIEVPNRDTTILYIENKENKKGLLFIEFYLLDEKKDIIFRLNRYDPESDEFKPVHDTGKTNKKCKLVVYFEEKSLYQIEFDNSYSWLNTKEIYYTISLIRIADEEIKNIKEEENNIKNEINNEIINIENKENVVEKGNKKENKDKDNNEFKVCDAILNNRKIIKFYCNNEDQNFTFNCNKIYKKIKGYQELEKNNVIQNEIIKISIIIHLNKLRIVTLDNNEKIIYKEIVDEKEKIITKSFFNKTILNYINENYKNEENKKILINLYSNNKNLSVVSNKIKDLINALKEYSINNVDQKQNRIYAKFLQKLGFYPDKKIGEYELMYNLYDFSDQVLIYHLFLVHCQQKYVESSTLVLIFDKDTLHVTALNEGGIYSKFKNLENEWKYKYYSKLKMDNFKSIVEFITAISDSFDGLDLVLCYMNNDDKKDDLLALFKQIKQYSIEKIEEPINVYIYQEEELVRKIFKYIWLFSEE